MERGAQRLGVVSGGVQHLQEGEEATGRGQSPSAIREGGGLGDGDHRRGETGQEVPSRTGIPQEAGTPPRLRRGGGRQRMAGPPRPGSASPWKRWVGCLRQAPEAGPPSLGCGLGPLPALGVSHGDKQRSPPGRGHPAFPAEPAPRSRSTGDAPSPSPRLRIPRGRPSAVLGLPSEPSCRGLSRRAGGWGRGGAPRAARAGGEGAPGGRRT